MATLHTGIDGGSIGNTTLGCPCISSYENMHVIDTSFGGSSSIYKHDTQANLSINTGHCDLVNDMSHASLHNNYCLLIVSSDQTYRLWVPIPSSSASTSPTINANTKYGKR